MGTLLNKTALGH